MSDHNKQDAFDFIRTDIQRRLRLYKRRIQKEAETGYEQLLSEHTREFPNVVADHIYLAERALEDATIKWLGVEAVPRPALEAGNAS